MRIFIKQMPISLVFATSVFPAKNPTPLRYIANIILAAVNKLSSPTCLSLGNLGNICQLHCLKRFFLNMGFDVRAFVS